MNKILSNPVVKALLEHSLRGGLVALVAAYVSGDLVFDNVNIHTFSQVVAIFVGGFIVSLLAGLGIHMSTGTGPALNKAESFETPVSAGRRKKTQRGVAELTVIAVCAIIVAICALLWLFGVHVGR